ncbi:hypothetical protein SKAU_G00245320 [Synaphobranchus kaupii]|uniref:Uncharacterized protein n=1 Tax=Synaphobranchus kaupii TaxID=118154 RepID=A0A9Q1IRC4_SYNKA|nr:hypothetical protein SKAU_G00245320 [Synaphobranchus kaupii]
MFIGVEELQHATAPGNYAAMSTALDKADLSQWKEKVVGLGTDGAAVMVGRLGGVTTLLRAEVPHLINIQCLAHGLELAAMDAMKDHERMRKVMDVLKGLYKQYHHSPKAWRELKDLAGVLNQKVWKPTNLGGTRWLPCTERALRVMLRNYPVLLAQMENMVETRLVINSYFLDRQVLR